MPAHLDAAQADSDHLPTLQEQAVGSTKGEEMTMEHIIEIRARDTFPALRFVAMTEHCANPARSVAIGSGATFWSAIADVIREAHTDLFGRYHATNWQ